MQAFFSFFLSFFFSFFSLSNAHNLDMKLKFICAPLSPFQLCKQGCWYDNVQDYHVHSTNTCGQVMRHKPLPGSRVVLKWPGCLVHHTSSSPGWNNTSRPQAVQSKEQWLRRLLHPALGSTSNNCSNKPDPTAAVGGYKHPTFVCKLSEIHEFKFHCCHPAVWLCLTCLYPLAFWKCHVRWIYINWHSPL